MIAAIHTQYGPPEVVRVQDVAQLVPKPDEVLIQVHTSTVNRTDCGFRSAEYFVSRFWSGLLKPKYTTLGCEYAGTVKAVGAAVTEFKVGDEVFGYNDEQFGGHATYTVQKAAGSIALKPPAFNFQTAAAISEGAHYALGNIRAAKVAAGMQVLVYGATGAIGSAAVQLLKAMEVKVVAVCSTPHIQLVKKLGADVVVDYLHEDFTQLPMQFDLVFDAVGKTSFGVCKAILKPQGLYISTELGKGAENVFLAIWGSFRKKNKRVLFPIPTTSKADILFLKSLCEQGKFTPLIDRVYKLSDIVEAYRYVETGQKVGNVVIEIGD